MQHPGLVQIFDVGTLEDGTTYLVMELLTGETLARRLLQRGGRLGVAEVLALAWQIADVMTTLHDTGVVHRDLKPDNVMLVRDPLGYNGERIKVLDLGVARLRVSGWQGCELTRRNVGMGTAMYMAPEQCLDARDADGRADVYSLGVMLFELLTGEPPLVADDFDELIRMQLIRPAPSLLHAAPHAPGTLGRLVDTMLNKDRAQRPRMSEVRDALLAMQRPVDTLPEAALPVLELERAPTMVWVATRKQKAHSTVVRPKGTLRVLRVLALLLGLLCAPDRLQGFPRPGGHSATPGFSSGSADPDRTLRATPWSLPLRHIPRVAPTPSAPPHRPQSARGSALQVQPRNVTSAVPVTSVQPALTTCRAAACACVLSVHPGV